MTAKAIRPKSVEWRFAVRTKIIKTSEETGVEEEEPVTPKSNRKAKVSSNKRGREIETESPSSPPTAPKKRVDIISWETNNNTTDEIKSKTEGKICVEVTVAIRTL